MSTPQLDGDGWFILGMGVRYSIGRASYGVGLTTDWVKEHWHVIPKTTREFIRREVKQALADKAPDGMLGMGMDHERWVALAVFMEATP